MQPTTCIRGITQGVMIPATFAANNRYAVYNLFARNNTVISYQLYVGDSVPDGDSSPLQGRYVRVTPHLTSTDNANGLSSFRSQVIDACDPNSTGQWCSGMPKPTVPGRRALRHTRSAADRRRIPVRPALRLRSLHAA